PFAPYASSASAMADGPQSPSSASARLSHSWTRPWSSRWNAAVVLAWPRIVSAIWMPAGAHDVSLISCAKYFAGFFRMLTSTARRGIAVGPAVADGPGDRVGAGTGVITGPAPGSAEAP